MLEPVTGNMGVIEIDLDFIKPVKNAVLNLARYLDEMSAFRAQHTGSYEWTGVNPDIVILGKLLEVDTLWRICC